MKKRLLLSALTGTVVFGSVFAFAASLGGVTTDKLGADDSVVASCDTDGVIVDYDTAYSATDKEYEVTTVNVTGIAAGCAGQTVTVALVESGSDIGIADGTKIGDGAVASLAGTSAAVAVNEAPAAEDVDAIHVVIAHASSSPSVASPS